MVFKDFRVLGLWIKVASALEGLNGLTMSHSETVLFNVSYGGMMQLYTKELYKASSAQPFQCQYAFVVT